jgi:hypothetical protein
MFSKRGDNVLFFQEKKRSELRERRNERSKKSRSVQYTKHTHREGLKVHRLTIYEAWLRSTLSIAALITVFLGVKSIPNRSSKRLLTSRLVTVLRSATRKISCTAKFKSPSLGNPPICASNSSGLCEDGSLMSR